MVPVGLLLRSTQPLTVRARSCRPRMPNERAFARSSAPRPTPLSLISSDSTPPAIDRSMATCVACACLLMLVSASCAVRYATSGTPGPSGIGCVGARSVQAMPVRRSKRAVIHCRAASSPCSRMAGRRLCMIRWLDSMAAVTVSSAPCTRACTSAESECRAIHARSNFSAVSEPPTSSWISRAIAARSISMLVCRC